MTFNYKPVCKGVWGIQDSRYHTHTTIQGGPKKWATNKWSKNRIKACQWD